MKQNLFGTEHNPGGAVKSVLPAGITGDAEFHGDNHEYRLVLWRQWDQASSPREWPVSIGMNASTADAKHNDPTITREMALFQRLGFGGLWKLNLSAYRATEPGDLARTPLPIDIEANREAIYRLARYAPRVVMTCGNVPTPLRTAAREITRALMHQHNVVLWCFGTTASGAPRHPLYLKRETPLEPWWGWPANIW